MLALVDELREVEDARERRMLGRVVRAHIRFPLPSTWNLTGKAFKIRLRLMDADKFVSVPYLQVVLLRDLLG